MYSFKIETMRYIAAGILALIIIAHILRLVGFSLVRSETTHNAVITGAGIVALVLVMMPEVDKLFGVDE